MVKRSTIFFAVAGAVALGAALVALREGRPNVAEARPSDPPAIPLSNASSEAAPSRPNREEPQTVATLATPAAAPPAASAVRRDEPSLMAELHELGETNSPLSLQLAREGDERFPGSADGPERGWILVKSLVNMRRLDEAKAEAVVLVEKYRGTSWAADIERHLLVNPLYPTEDSEP